MDNKDRRRRASELEDLISKNRYDLQSNEAELKRLQSSCPHDWTDPVYDPKVTKKFESDPNRGVWRGVDFMPEIKVVEHSTPRWSRTCRLCKLTQYTEDTISTTTKKPKFG